MSEYALAVDIGASNGRLMLGELNQGQLLLEEIHRFDNRMLEHDNHLYWDLSKLFAEIKEGIRKCVSRGIKPATIGIDTWAVDFVLLDEKDELLTDAVAYRDPRTNGMMEKVLTMIDRTELYAKTGIQFQKFNTIYQLIALKQNSPDTLAKAKTFLMIPDYLNFLLTGKKVNEYTNATTTQLVNASAKTWDGSLIDMLGFNREMFLTIQAPQTTVGPLKEELVEEFGFSMDVVLPGTHDTASAVVSVPVIDETIYISSGTWSLIGVESEAPINDRKALDYNFTNEGGVDFRYRFLKNIMGLWMIQEVKRNYEDRYSFADFVRLSEEATIQSVVNVDDDRFLNPAHMISEIQQYCKETGQQVPVTPGEIAKCVYDSLVDSYQKAIGEIVEMTGSRYETIHIIGGGSQNTVLNQRIADATGKTVFTGPIEATAAGNLLVQFMCKRNIVNLKEARKIIAHSFPITEYRRRSRNEQH